VRHFFVRRFYLGERQANIFIGLAEEVAWRKINVIDWIVKYLKPDKLVTTDRVTQIAVSLTEFLS
jgi:hypothetical protein